MPTPKVKGFQDLSPRQRAEVIAWMTDQLTTMEPYRAFLEAERPGLIGSLEATLRGLKDFDKALRTVRPV